MDAMIGPDRRRWRSEHEKKVIRGNAYPLDEQTWPGGGRYRSEYMGVQQKRTLKTAREEAGGIHQLEIL